jgi:hypothetical protein
MNAAIPHKYGRFSLIQWLWLFQDLCFSLLRLSPCTLYIFLSYSTEGVPIHFNNAHSRLSLLSLLIPLSSHDGPWAAQFMAAVVEPTHWANRSGDMISDSAGTLAGCIVERWWMKVAMDANASGLTFPH